MKTYKIPTFLLFLLFSCCTLANGQDAIQRSLNGKSLPASGTLRVLLVFAEIEYDLHPNLDPLDPVKGTKGWVKGELPTWKDDMFDPHPLANPKARMTKFFSDCSFGNLKILGDYYDGIVTVKESSVKQISQYHILNQWVVKKISEGEFKTGNNLKIEDFDLWTMTKMGHPKITPSNDDPLLFDHVMVIYRNYNRQPDGTGRAAPGRFGKFFGFNTDSYSIFGAYERLPFNMARHEFIHLVLGDNNFHAGGGQSFGTNYFLPLQGGWSILGAANSSFMICSAWDRDRLGWVGPDKKYSLSAHNEKGQEVITDLDATKLEDEGIYILRDYVSTGDALRIKLPGIPENEYQQWIWIENHQTKAFNKSEFDSFQYSHIKCVDEPVPGIYSYMQVDKEVKEGPNLYSGYGDYIRAIPATGMYDFQFTEETIKNRCVNNGMYQAFIKSTDYENPLSGNHMLEFPVDDLDGNGSISSKEMKVIAIEKVGSEFIYKLPYLGHAEMAFTLEGNNTLGIGTNPSTANMYTLVSGEPGTRGGLLGKDGFAKPNNRAIYLNGVSIKLMENLSGGRIKVQIKFNETEISQNTRWCADSIVLPNIANADFDLKLSNESTLKLDFGLTPTRLIKPVEYKGEKIFANPTQFFIAPKSRMLLDEKSTLLVANKSKLVLLEQSELLLDNGSRLDIDKTSTLLIHSEAKIIIKNNSELIIRNKELFKKLQSSNAVEVIKGKFKYCR